MFSFVFIANTLIAFFPPINFHQNKKEKKIISGFLIKNLLIIFFVLSSFFFCKNKQGT
jgi:hypothetical protein